ncbi:putative quinol monooxygenase [Halostreptopolyspora alba]|uniref:ABM domain-containing protein n=1 Tax=Halostreptopolyspora alba TaxID=2487137 RepID=A0A3N0E9D8_9ACTN|nr:hypothetical protein EFW17_12885 [Nocardiopsaceae bacterium YIM 96095]
MVEVGLAFVCALVAWSATAALVALYSRTQQRYLLIWVVSTVSVAIALSAAFPGALLGFSEITFRLFQIGIALLGPLLAAWGAVEYAIRSPRVRFGSRLVVATLTIVPVVILVFDQLGGDFDSSLPPMSDHYDVIPMAVLGLVHMVVAVTLVGCVLLMLSRGRRRPRPTGQRASVLGLIGLAALLEIAISRFGLGLLGQLLAAGAVACVWIACVKAQNALWSDVDDEFDDDSFGMEDDVPRRRRATAEEPDDHGNDAGPPERSSSRLRGVITIYTIVDGHQDVFDDLAAEMVAEVTRREPDTLLFACHTVPSAPLQRIIYAIYRDQLAFEEHQQQPHIVEFSRRTHGRVAATNVIELALSGASASDSLAAMLMPR